MCRLHLESSWHQVSKDPTGIILVTNIIQAREIASWIALKYWLSLIGLVLVMKRATNFEVC